MLYPSVRAVVAFALKRFYRIEVSGAAPPATGAVILVGNHPNSLIDPAMLFAVTPRRLTFLAKAPLFEVPLFGALLRGLGALPVHRRQDDPTQMGKNEGTFAAAVEALGQGRAITLFPEGVSHSEPHLAELKTGCARIALRTVEAGTAVTLVPVGLTYGEKHRFRSPVLVEIGERIEVAPWLARAREDEAGAVRAFTEQIAQRLRQVTLNLEAWEDLPLIQTAEALYAFRLGESAHDPDRLRRFARGLPLFRAEQPERFERVKEEVLAFRRRLELVHADPVDLTLQYRRTEVYPFIARNAAAILFGFPLFALGCLLFALPFLLIRAVSQSVKVLPDRVGTLKFMLALGLSPAWVALLAWGGWRVGGPGLGTGVALGAVPLAVFTRYFLERRTAALRDAVTFLVLGNRARLKARLLVEGELLAKEIERVAVEFKPRVELPPPR